MESRNGNHDAGRYGVVRYQDGIGAWYGVIDKQSDSRRNIVFASRSRNVAHEHADERNRVAR